MTHLRIHCQLLSWFQCLFAFLVVCEVHKRGEEEKKNLGDDFALVDVAHMLGKESLTVC